MVLQCYIVNRQYKEYSKTYSHVYISTRHTRTPGQWWLLSLCSPLHASSLPLVSLSESSSVSNFSVLQSLQVHPAWCTSWSFLDTHLIQEHPFINCLFYLLLQFDTLPKYWILTVQEILFWWLEKSKVCMHFIEPRVDTPLIELSNPTGAHPVSPHSGTVPSA